MKTARSGSSPSAWTREIGLEAADLAAERVAPRDDVDEPEQRLVSPRRSRAARAIRPAQDP